MTFTHAHLIHIKIIAEIPPRSLPGDYVISIQLARARELIYLFDRGDETRFYENEYGFYQNGKQISQCWEETRWHVSSRYFDISLMSICFFYRVSSILFCLFMFCYRLLFFICWPIDLLFDESQAPITGLFSMKNDKFCYLATCRSVLVHIYLYYVIMMMIKIIIMWNVRI